MDLSDEHALKSTTSSDTTGKQPADGEEADADFLMPGRVEERPGSRPGDAFPASPVRFSW